MCSTYAAAGRTTTTARRSGSAATAGTGGRDRRGSQRRGPSWTSRVGRRTSAAAAAVSVSYNMAKNFLGDSGLRTATAAPDSVMVARASVLAGGPEGTTLRTTARTTTRGADAYTTPARRAGRRRGRVRVRHFRPSPAARVETDRAGNGSSFPAPDDACARPSVSESYRPCRSPRSSWPSVRRAVTYTRALVCDGRVRAVRHRATTAAAAKRSFRFGPLVFVPEIFRPRRVRFDATKPLFKIIKSEFFSLSIYLPSNE